jgi:hypothetical protein
MPDFTSFEIKYETDSDTPAPFAHFYHIQSHFDANNQVQINYQLRYLDRKSLTEEEILSEGFSLDDDFTWQGVLPLVWKDEIQHLIEKTTFRTKASKETDAFFEVVISEASGKKREGEPVNRTEWEYAAQELIQAIYETAKREMPLQLQYKKIHTDGSFLKLSLTLHFSNRQVEISQETQAGKPIQHTAEWPQLKDLLQKAYMPDYYQENAQPKEPKKAGTFIDSGDGLWYEFGSSVRNPSKKRDVLAEIEKIFEGLSRD